MIMRSFPTQLTMRSSNPRSLSMTRRLGPVGYRRQGGLGDLNFGANGSINCAGLDPSLCNTNVLEQGLSLVQGRPLATVQQGCNQYGVPGAGCVGYLENVAQYLQSGNLVYSNGQFSWCGPGSGTWSGPVNSTCVPVPPSQTAAMMSAAQLAADPLSAEGCSGGKCSPSVPSVYSQQQAANLSPAPPQPQVVNPSPPSTQTNQISPTVNPYSAVGTANGVVSGPGNLASTVAGLIPTGSTLISGIPDWMIIGAAAVAGIILLTHVKL